MTAIPRIVGNHNRPSLVFHAAGKLAPLHSLLFIPSDCP